MSTFVATGSSAVRGPLRVQDEGERRTLVAHDAAGWTLLLTRDEATELRDKLAEVLR